MAGKYCHSDYKRFIFDDLATLFVNLVNFGPATPAFKIGKDVGQHSVVSFFKINISHKLGLFQDAPEQCLQVFHHMVNVSSAMI